MKKNFKNLYTIGAIALLFGAAVACSEEEPLNMAPTLNMNEATNIMRTSVTFNGSITGKTSSIKDFGFQYSLSEDFTANLTKNVSIGDTLSSSMCQTTVIGLEAAERYYYRMYASTGATTVYSNSEYFQTQSSSAPVFTALQIDSIGENNARFRCTIADVGDEHLIEYGISYKTSADKAWIPVPSDSIIPVSISGAENTFYLEISGLTPATKYSFRPYAKNSSSADSSTGTREGYGTEVQAQTESLLSAEVQTSEVEDGHIGINSIDVSGTILSAVGSKGVIDKVGFCWSENNRTPVITDNSEEFDPVRVGESFKMTIRDLKPSTEYYVRAWAKNTVNGETRVGYGETRTVKTTGLNTPQIEWNEGVDDEGYWISAAEATANTINIKATIKNYDENAIVEKGLIWDKASGSISLAKAKENGTILSLDLATGGKEINATIQGLELARRYYIRAYAIYKAAGLEEIGYSNTYEVSTRDFEAPSLSSTDIKDVTRKGATLIGGMSSEGNATIIQKGFCLVKSEYAIYSPELTSKDAIVIVSDDDSFTETVGNLNTATGYYVRTFAITEIAEVRKDTTYSWSSNHFSTSDIERPSINFNSAYSEGNTIKLEASLYSAGEGEIIERGFVWRPDSVGGEFNIVNNTSVIAEGTNDLFTCTIKDLSFSTTYHVQPYVKSVVDNDTIVTYMGWYHNIYLDFNTAEIERPTIEDDKIAFSSAVLTTKFRNAGSFPIKKKGFCVHLEETTSEPSLNNNLYVLDADDSFTATLTGLKHDTRYSVRAFATYMKDNVEETVYSSNRSFGTKRPESYTFNNIVIKSDSTTMSSLYYTCGVAEEGDGELLEKGFIWKQRPKDSWNWQYPSFEDDKNYAEDGHDGYKAVADGELNEYSLKITGLKPSTNYYVRSYVKVKVEQSEYVYYSDVSQDGTSYLPVNLNFTVYADSCYVEGSVTDLPEGVDEVGLCYSSDTNLSVDDMENIAKAVMADDFKDTGSFTVGLSDLAQSVQYKVGFYFKLNGEYIRVDNGWYFTTRRQPTINDNVSPGKKDE